MRFKRLDFAEGSGNYSKRVETYNYHKACAVLAEYGFDCIRLSDDWRGADFLANHRDTGQILYVQLKTCLVIDEKYLDHPELYMCFPIDGTGNWYLIKHCRLMELVREHSPHWSKSKRYTQQRQFWSWKANRAMRKALSDYAYKALHGSLGYREVRESLRQEVDK